MFVVEKTDVFLKWLRGLRDIRAIARIQVRIDRMALGNPGDVKAIGVGVSEIRIDYGPGYRLYFSQRGTALVVLLCGGSKQTQKADIVNAKILAKEWADET